MLCIYDHNFLQLYFLNLLKILNQDTCLTDLCYKVLLKDLCFNTLPVISLLNCSQYNFFFFFSERSYFISRQEQAVSRGTSQAETSSHANNVKQRILKVQKVCIGKDMK